MKTTKHTPLHVGPLANTPDISHMEPIGDKVEPVPPLQIGTFTIEDRRTTLERELTSLTVTEPTFQDFKMESDNEMIKSLITSWLNFKGLEDYEIKITNNSGKLSATLYKK